MSLINKELDSNYLVLLITLNYLNPMHTYALTDSDGLVIAFIDTYFATLYKFPLT